MRAQEKTLKGIRLQKRDYEILKMLLDQKFLSLEMVYLRFFCLKESIDTQTPKNLWTVRKRLSKLRRSGLIKTEKVLLSGKGHYLITRRGVQMLESSLKENIPLRETRRIDFSLYLHDFKISMIRVLLEIRGKCREWYSEKRIRSLALPLIEDTFRFGPDFYPDAVFINSKGDRTALELEVSRKGFSRIREKLDHYGKLIDEGILDKVWVVTTKPSIGRLYNKALNDLYFNSQKTLFEEEEDKDFYKGSRFRIDDYEKVILPKIETAKAG